MKGVAHDTRKRGMDFPVRRTIRAVCAASAAAVWLGLLAGGDAPWLPTAVAQLPMVEEMPPSPKADDVRFVPAEPLASIEIEGNVSIPAEAIAKYIKAQVGRTVTPTQVQEDVRALYATRWFFSVEPRFRETPQGLVLVFKVLERPTVGRVEFRGNKKLKTKYLLALLGLKEGSPFDPSANREAARRILREYKDRGHCFAKVELISGGDSDDRDVIFEIDEGPVVRVTSVKFTGNETFSDALLKTKLRTKTAFLWKFGGKYDKTSVPDDIAALKQYYHDLGFFDVRISEQIHFSKDRAQVQLEYIVTEGQRYTVRNIQLAGHRIYREDELREQLTMTSGEFFNARKLHKDVNTLKDMYGRLGRIFATIDAVPRYSEEPGIVDLVYQINEDRVYHIRQINVHLQGDNPHTKDTVVLNRLLFQPGDPADPNLIRRSESRLGGQIFERGGAAAPQINIRRVPDEEVQFAGDMDVRGQSPDNSSLPPSRYRIPTIYHEADVTTLFRGQSPAFRAQNFDGPLPAPGNPMYGNSPQGDPFGESINDPPPGYIDVDVLATEARTGRLMFGVGVNSDAGVVGSIVLDESNFDIMRPPRSFQEIIDGTAWRGGGQRFRLELVPGNIVSRYMASWTDPYFLDTDYSLGVSGFYYNRFLPDWDEQRAGGRVTIGRQLTRELSVSAAIRLEDVQIDNPDIPTPQLLIDSLGNSFLSTARVAVAHDTRDSAFLPSEGHFVEGSYEQAFGDFDYPRFGVEGSQFFTLFSRPDGTGKHILKVGGEFGWTGEDTPIFERYYAGGFQTFRGFEFRGVSPREFDVRLGGRWLMLGTAEYQMPLTASDAVGMVFFTDFGTVEEDAGLDHFRVTAGVGLRLTVPAMGPVPLAFDFAVPIMKEDFDDTQVFSFYIGLNR